MVRRRDSVSSIADIFRANIVDVSKESMIIALTGSLSKMNAFIELLRNSKLIEGVKKQVKGVWGGGVGV